jgi:hypothetical protein
MVRLNYIYNIYGGDAMMRMDGSAPWTQFKDNVYYHSRLPFGVLFFGWGLFLEGNVFLDVHPVNAEWYIGDTRRPIPFRGNLIFENDFSKEPIDWSKYENWLENFHEIYRVLDGNYLPGKLEGVEEIKKRLREAIEQIRPYFKQYEVR